MAAPARTWLWVVVGLVVFVVLAIVAIAGVGVYVISRSVAMTAATSTEAASEFDGVRERFAGQVPLIELDSQGRLARSHTDRPASGGPAPTHLHLLAYEPSDARIVRFRAPFWLLRLRAGRASVEVEGARVNLDELDLTIDDLERYGPVLVLDHQAPAGERVLVWTE